jgi:serine protease inhibitor
VTIRDHLTFSLELHRAINPDLAANACFSPYSVASALGLVAAGAGGQTRSELLSALAAAGEGNLDEQAKLLAVAATLEKSPASEQPPVLAVTNTLWANRDVQIEPDYRAELERWPGGAVRAAPFDSDPEHAREIINAVVAEHTRDLIPALLPPGSVHADTRAALVNALYLKSAWVNTFVESDTTPQPFRAVAGQREVPTMRLTKRFGYAAEQGWQLVALPADGGLEAVILLPDGDLAAEEPALSAQRLDSLLAAASSTRVALWLPKFDVGARCQLDGPLRELGIRRVFTDQADLSGISTSERLAISAALHQAVLRVDENGFEGAAATAAVFLASAVSVRSDPIEVRVDRPFLFLVRHRQGPVYFLARITEPS